MFCHQCQEASKGTGCEIRGVSGKSPRTATLQDALVHLCRGAAVFAQDNRRVAARRALFATITSISE